MKNNILPLLLFNFQSVTLYRFQTIDRKVFICKPFYKEMNKEKLFFVEYKFLSLVAVNWKKNELFLHFFLLYEHFSNLAIF